MNLRRYFLLLTLAAALLGLTGCGKAVIYDQSAYTPGTTEGLTYSNPHLGLSITLSGEWLVYGPENYEAVIGLKQDLDDREMVEEILNAGQAIYEFYAAHADRTIVRVTVEDLRVRYGDITALDYAEIQANHLPKMANAFSLENVEVTLGTTELAGQSCPSGYLTSEMVHVPHYEHYVYIRNGDYLYTVLCSSVENDRCAELLALFEPAA